MAGTATHTTHMGPATRTAATTRRATVPITHRATTTHLAMGPVTQSATAVATNTSSRMIGDVLATANTSPIIRDDLLARTAASLVGPAHALLGRMQWGVHRWKSERSWVRLLPCHSKRRASCSRLNCEPASLSSARKPGGRFVHTRVTSVPTDTSSKVAVSVISPKRVGSVVMKLTASTILRGGANSTNRTLTMSSLSDVLPREPRSLGG